MNPFTQDSTASIASLGERRVIAAIRRWLGSSSPKAPFGLGDDCAVVPPSNGPQLLTVDPVIYGQHFDDKVSPAAAGAKLFKRNLSDIAAMGGIPRFAVIALAIDPCVRIRWLELFYRSIARISRTYDVPIVGGMSPSSQAALSRHSRSWGPRAHKIAASSRGAARMRATGSA
jgi:thiamine-monophosphate kinase